MSNASHPDHAIVTARRDAIYAEAVRLSALITMDDTPEQWVIGVQHQAMMDEYQRLCRIIKIALDEDAIEAGAVGDY